jgi:hypothetical protein
MRKTEEDKRKTKSEALKVAWVIRLFIIMWWNSTINRLSAVGVGKGCSTSRFAPLMSILERGICIHLVSISVYLCLESVLCKRTFGLGVYSYCLYSWGRLTVRTSAVLLRPPKKIRHSGVKSATIPSISKHRFNVLILP